MLFLLNDLVFNIDTQTLDLPLDGAQFAALRLDTVSALGAEMFSANPTVHHSNPEKAVRLAGLIAMKAPKINAALFVAPRAGCGAAQVACRYAQVDFSVISGLWSRQEQGSLGGDRADSEVWRRLAA